MTRYESFEPDQKRVRLWPVFVAPLAILVLALGWSAFWFYAAHRVEGAIEAWRTREAAAGRTYDCGTQGVGGYPFRLEVRCDDAKIGLTSNAPPLDIGLQSLLVVAQVYDPTLLIAEFTSPAKITPRGSATTYLAQWSLAQSSVRGTPSAPQRVSFAFEKPKIDEVRGGQSSTYFEAEQLEVHGRLIGGSISDQPVIELASRLVGAIAPAAHLLAAKPFNASSVVVLRGLKNFAPKPWPARFREIQEANGAIEIMQSRFEQGEVLGVSSGTLRLSASGHLEGEIQMIVAGMDKIIPALGLDKLLQEGVPQDRLDRIAPGVDAGKINNALSALDRLVPGLGNVARQHVNTGVQAGLTMIGKPTELEGKKAIAVPLRFANGAIMLGPVQVGRMPSLF